MADKTLVISLPRISSEPVLPATDQGSVYVYYEVPTGYNLSLGITVNPRQGNWKRYTGNVGGVLGSECGIAPPPVTDPLDPVWNNSFSLPPFVAGQAVEIEVPYSALTPASNQSIVSIREVAGGLPGFLSLIQRAGQVPVLRGTVPVGYTSYSVQLIGYQGNGRGKDKTFTAYATAANVYAYVATLAANRQIYIQVGGQAGSLPKVRLVGGPSGYDGTQYTCRDWVAIRDGIKYYYSFENYTNMPFGTYVIEITHLGQTRYGTVNFTGANTQNPLSLATSPGGTDTGGSSTTTVVAVDAQFTTSSVVNPAPTLSNPQPDVTITAPGDFSITLPENEFSDQGDTKNLSVWKLGDGGAMEELTRFGFRWVESTRTIYGMGSMANQELDIRVVCADSASQAVWDDWKLVINRPTGPALAAIGRRVHDGYIDHYFKVNNWDTSTEIPIYFRYRRQIGSVVNNWTDWITPQRVAGNPNLDDASILALGYQFGTSAIYVNNGLGNAYTLDIQVSTSSTGASPVSITYYVPPYAESGTDERPSHENFHVIYPL